MRISDWSSDVCSSDLYSPTPRLLMWEVAPLHWLMTFLIAAFPRLRFSICLRWLWLPLSNGLGAVRRLCNGWRPTLPKYNLLQTLTMSGLIVRFLRSDEQTFELQSLIRIFYAVFFL